MVSASGQVIGIDMTPAMLTIENVHHNRLTVTDVERAGDFYAGVLGVHVAAELPTPEGVLLSNGGTLLGLRPAGALVEQSTIDSPNAGSDSTT